MILNNIKKVLAPAIHAFVWRRLLDTPCILYSNYLTNFYPNQKLFKSFQSIKSLKTFGFEFQINFSDLVID
jgi:hypothetical protein